MGRWKPSCDDFQWFPYAMQEVPAGMPGGWNALYQARGLSVKQSIGVLEAATGGMCVQPNQYVVLNEQGQKVFVAEEDSECCCRCCCAPHHEFTINVRDHNNAPVLGIYHPCKCSGCFACSDCCRNEVEIYEGEAQMDKEWRENNRAQLRGVLKVPVLGGGFTPTIMVHPVINGKMVDEPEGEITGPTCCIGACCDASFFMQPPGSESKGQFGKITKQGMKDLGTTAQQLFTDADIFQMQFEVEDPYFRGAGGSEETPLKAAQGADFSQVMWTKAKLLSSLFMLDYQFFEDDHVFELCPEPGVLCSIKCCDLYCWGCLMPCKLKCQKGGDDD